jgi:hypothetical protein
MKRALILLVLGTLVSGVAAYAATTRVVAQPATTTKG